MQILINRSFNSQILRKEETEMNLIRRSANPLTRLITIPGRLDLFDDVLADSPFRSLLDSFFRDQAHWPAVDIFEKEGDIIIRAEVPGMSKGDIDVKLTGNVITLSGEKKADKGDVDNYRRMESWYGSFSRSFTLPDTADPDRVKAEYNNGVLTIQVPRVASTKTVTIPVGVHQ
jgi:HSP20 family protein